jgi:hypothetical protein
VVHFLGKPGRYKRGRVKKIVREVLGDFKEIFSDADLKSLDNLIIANFNGETVLGSDTYSGGIFYRNGMIELLFDKNYGDSKTDYMMTALHELIHYEHHSIVSGKRETPDIPNFIESYRVSKESGILDEIRDWTSKVWRDEMLCKAENPRSYTTTQKRLSEIRRVFHDFVPYVYYTNKYKQSGKLSELKDSTLCLINECKRGMKYHGVVPDIKNFGRLSNNQKDWESFVNFEAPLPDTAEGYEIINETIPHYVSLAWYRNSDSLVAEDIKNEFCGIDNSNVKYLEDVLRLHRKVVSQLVKEKPWLKEREARKEAVKLIANEIVWAKNPKHLELICNEYTNNPGLLLELSTLRRGNKI